MRKPARYKKRKTKTRNEDQLLKFTCKCDANKSVSIGSRYGDKVTIEELVLVAPALLCHIFEELTAQTYRPIDKVLHEVISRIADQAFFALIQRFDDKGIPQKEVEVPEVSIGKEDDEKRG